MKVPLCKPLPAPHLPRPETKPNSEVRSCKDFLKHITVSLQIVNTHHHRGAICRHRHDGIIGTCKLGGCALSAMPTDHATHNPGTISLSVTHFVTLQFFLSFSLARSIGAPSLLRLSPPRSVPEQGCLPHGHSPALDLHPSFLALTSLASNSASESLHHPVTTNREPERERTRERDRETEGQTVTQR